MLLEGSRTYYPLTLNDNVTVSESGYLGIGTNEPTGTLHIKALNPKIQFEIEDEESWTLGDYGKYEGFKIKNGSDAKFIIKDGGYVGMGTETPDAELHIRGGGNADLRLESGSAAEWNIAGGSNFFIAEVDDSDNYHDYITINQDSPLRVRNYDGSTSLRADANEGVAIGSGNVTPPAEGLFVKGVITLQGGSDIAEPFEFEQTDEVEPGMVVTIDSDNPGKLKVSETAYDRCVAGIISGAGGVKPGLTLTQDGMFEGSHHVALTGRVYAMCDAGNGPIQPGDLLTTSDTPGHAMKVKHTNKARGAIIGKAMSGLDSGQGLVLVLVSLQ
ncbi:MAG: hypothetical protein U5R06_01055 [candidate division KSB1 bacterium]|nr:hypothetical protein [candidate division KSB1 bacterium]